MSQQYTRFSLVDLGEGIEAIKNNRKNDQRVMLGGQPIVLGSLRLRTFAKCGTTCAYCGLKATHFAIEKTSQNSIHNLYHMNLWGLCNGDEVLFTHDHVLARGLGGEDNLNNSVTACAPCNSKKSKYETGICNRFKNKKFSLNELIQTIKQIYNQDKITNFFQIKGMAL